MNSVFKYIATLLFIGYLPIAQGTFGTLVAFLICILLKPTLLLHMMILLTIIPIGILSSHRAEMLLNERDSRHIVIDEFCGYFFAMIAVPFSLSYSLIAFFLFRVFDILKPFPIRTIESYLHGGIGIMADDIMAAIYTNIVLQILLTVNPALFSYF
jgi:phosphatidylglycerophosphatase A